MRTREYVTTYMGHHVRPLAATAADIDIRDVAHALARLGRANGHFADFYSVGQHCIDCAREALARGLGARQALICLLHDAAEAYLADITSPVKKELRQYVAAEDRLLDVIYGRFAGGIRPKEQLAMKEIDNAMLYYEFVHFMNERLTEDAPTLAITPCFDFTSFAAVESRYLELFDDLSAEAAREAKPRGFRTAGIVYGNGAWHLALCSGEDCAFHTAADLASLCELCRDADAVLTDLPVGLAEDASDAALCPDGALRRLLVGQGAAAPCRQAVYAESDRAAVQENLRVLGRALSPEMQQTRAALRELDTLFLERNPWKNVLRQSHPRFLGAERDSLARRYAAGDGQNAWQKDALALAQIGQMECRGECVTVPEKPQIDARGIRWQLIVPQVLAARLDGEAGK